jgi:hypothetical protein
MSKIGKPQRVIEIEPIEEPAAEPVKVPEPVPPAVGAGGPRNDPRLSDLASHRRPRRIDARIFPTWSPAHIAARSRSRALSVLGSRHGQVTAARRAGR